MPQAEGKKFSFVGEEHIRTDFLETIPFDRNEEKITIETEEFSAVCPFSGLPDIGKLIIEYYPDGGKIVELKSLKYYLVSFRNVGIYQEKATVRIYDDLKNILGTKRIKVKLIYNIRGGILTTTEVGSLEG
ncbi:7-cyano-7-deazaguanine reductase [Thermosipho melanesiensis]|uniref:NADPH-dependent 7-cyano-7-deazaguanine reductase n=2 Tax=Thermosipho melanesiensis TaxID=46541 RepID=A6LJH6_THEM4|nr:preQ(1) synthase [Thermosipho melanesiensis]ABR30077.1 GTP cyclohydrolase I [Thermosipho melanesiensis BI429]APT73274.1 7-cyano-7-deazaguanine reductase [Thermosipho melanesiensis]OOC38741.1 7-cyano-7-deazaguanine reductase [Thermosipho melanesiensis]OOC40546.1 7-cyano-7-deazaguanine reductase [Thermosipho melanesiensis]OOC40809.1 7-cyano-7-deazaguanine reductase [Thermosipho melanesiensis]